MADRYQNRSFPGGDYDRDNGSQGTPKAESDPLAELARLIGQTDPFGTGGTMSRANLPLQPHARPQARPTYQDDHEFLEEPEDEPPPALPSWMQRAAHQQAGPTESEDYSNGVHPLHRYAASHPPAQVDYDREQPYEDAGQEPDPSRYDDALYGAYDRDTQPNQSYADDDYVYDEDPGDVPAPKRRGGMITVAAVLALAVFGVGGAFAYRTYSSSARGGEPPIIRADASPTKIIPSPPDGTTKVPDRMTSGDGMEKIVSREETPLDPNTRSVPRIVWPTPNQTASAAPAVNSAPSAPAATGSVNGTLPTGEPHRIRTVPVRGDQADAGVPPAAAPPPAPTKLTPRAATTPPRSVSAANAAANAPLSLAPQASAQAEAVETPTRIASTNPAQTVPTGGATASGGGYLVQVSSQLSEADAQASYRSLQSKYPGVLGSQPLVVKRVDLGEKGVRFRALAGPFASADQATHVCNSLKSAGGPQCLIQRN